MSHSAVLDVQFFYLPTTREYIVKEFAVKNLSTSYEFVALFKPPYINLKHEDETQVKFVSKNLMKIAWHSGNIDYVKLDSICQTLDAKYSRFYVKGDVKRKILLEKMQRPIINIEKLPFYSIPLKEIGLQKIPCKNHFDVYSNKICALANVRYIYDLVRVYFCPMFKDY